MAVILFSHRAADIIRAIVTIRTLVAASIALILSGCVGDTARIPVGTWRELGTSRYLSVEPDAKNERYLVRLFRYSEKGARLERQLSAHIQDGLLNLQADGVTIPILYHPSNQLILINGKNEFLRVNAEDATRPLVNLQDAKDE